MKRWKIFLLILISQERVFAVGGVAPADKLNLRIKQQVLQIERDAKHGTLTKDQAKFFKVQVEAIRKAEITELKQNGTKTLTDIQLSQLNEQLNTLSKSIPIK